MYCIYVCKGKTWNKNCNFQTFILPLYIVLYNNSCINSKGKREKIAAKNILPKQKKKIIIKPY